MSRSCTAGSDLFCFINPSQLASALLNLCINARDALPKGGRLWLERHPEGTHSRPVQSPRLGSSLAAM